MGEQSWGGVGDGGDVDVVDQWEKQLASPCHAHTCSNTKTSSSGVDPVPTIERLSILTSHPITSRASRIENQCINPFSYLVIDRFSLIRVVIYK
jgi:hypothetical protein